MCEEDDETSFRATLVDGEEDGAEAYRVGDDTGETEV